MTVLSSRPAVIEARSLAFHAASVLVVLAFLPALVLVRAPRRIAWPVLRAFFWVQLWLLRRICAQRVEVAGLRHLPDGPCILAARHESAWETMFLPYRFDNPAVLLKREILAYPVAGPVARAMGYIGVDRSGDLGAAKESFQAARAEAEAGRRLLIFPSGTRDPDQRDRVQTGVAVLYRTLGLPCVPVVHDSGDLWPYRSWLRRPGVIRVEVRPAIPAGLKTRDFVAALGNGLRR